MNLDSLDMILCTTQESLFEVGVYLVFLDCVCVCVCVCNNSRGDSIKFQILQKKILILKITTKKNLRKILMQKINFMLNFLAKTT